MAEDAYTEFRIELNEIRNKIEGRINNRARWIKIAKDTLVGDCLGYLYNSHGINGNIYVVHKTPNGGCIAGNGRVYLVFEPEERVYLDWSDFYVEQDYRNARLIFQSCFPHLKK